VDRRPAIFVHAGLACLLLVPVADGYAWVAAATAFVYALLALGFWLDARSRRRSARRR
jgi:hypothetical protein